MEKEDLPTEEELEYEPPWSYEQLKYNNEEFKRICKFSVVQFDNMMWPLVANLVVNFR